LKTGNGAAESHEPQIARRAGQRLVEYAHQRHRRDTENLAANTEYAFDGDGVDRFRILGIGVDALLDPADPEAFVTGLKFVATDTVDLTQTPITTFVASAPATPLLVATALLALGWRRLG